MTTLRFEDIACPKCGHDKHFHIDVTAIATLDTSGLSIAGDYYWDGHSCCTCLGCGFEANASEFVKSKAVQP